MDTYSLLLMGKERGLISGFCFQEKREKILILSGKYDILLPCSDFRGTLVLGKGEFVLYQILD